MVSRNVAQLIEVGLQHAGHAAAAGSPPRLALNVVPGCVERFVLVVAEEERPVLDDRAAAPAAGVAEVERAGIDRQALGLGADETVVAELVVERAAALVAAAARDGVHVRADEIALPHVVRRDVDLHLLDRRQRNRRDARRVAGRVAQAERVVEVRIRRP